MIVAMSIIENFFTHAGLRALLMIEWSDFKSVKHYCQPAKRLAVVLSMRIEAEIIRFPPP